jgi:hypothetical protein
VHNDGTSASAAMDFKKNKKRSKLSGVNDVSLRQGIMAVTSYTNPSSLLTPKKPQSELEKHFAEESARSQVNFSKYQQNKNAQKIKSTTSHILKELQESPGILQSSTVGTNDYEETPMDLFEERLVSELKNIGVLDEYVDCKTVIGAPSHRQDDEISAELRILQGQLREKMKPTNEIKQRVMEQIRSDLDDERRREKKDEEMRAIEREWNRHVEQLAQKK